MSIYIYIYKYSSRTILAQGFDPWEQEQEQEQETQKNILKRTEARRKALGNMCRTAQGPTLIRAQSLDAPGSFFVNRPRANSPACCRAPLPVCMLTVFGRGNKKTVLGASWGFLGALGTILGPSWRQEGPKSRKPIETTTGGNLFIEGLRFLNPWSYSTLEGNFSNA